MRRVGDLVVQGKGRITKPNLQRIPFHHLLFSGRGALQWARMRQNGVREKASEGAKALKVVYSRRRMSRLVSWKIGRMS